MQGAVGLLGKLRQEMRRAQCPPAGSQTGPQPHVDGHPRIPQTTWGSLAERGHPVQLPLRTAQPEAASPGWPAAPGWGRASRPHTAASCGSADSARPGAEGKAVVSPGHAWPRLAAPGSLGPVQVSPSAHTSASSCPTPPHLHFACLPLTPSLMSTAVSSGPHCLPMWKSLPIIAWRTPQGPGAASFLK